MIRATIRTMTALAVAAGLGACFTSPVRYDLTPVRSNGHDLSGLDSGAILESRQPGGIVSIRAEETFALFGASFAVAVQNKSGAPIEFGPANIEVFASGRRLAVLAADELDARVQAEVRSFIRAASRNDGVDLAAATPDVSREYRFNNYGGCPAGQSGCQVYSDDNGAGYRQDRINREFEAETLAAAASRLMANQALVEEKALRTASIAPEAMAGGVFVVEPPRAGGPIDIAITVNGRRHSFVFNSRPAA